MKSHEFRKTDDLNVAGAVRRRETAPTTLRIVIQKGRLLSRVAMYRTRPLGEKPKGRPKKSVPIGGAGEVA